MNQALSLWQQLRDQGFVQGSVPTERATPWYIRLLLGFSGWLASLFLLGFIAFIFVGALADSAAGFFVFGLVLCAVAIGLFRLTRHDFLRQAAFALSLAGQALLIIGFVMSSGSHIALSLFLIALGSILVVVVRDSLHQIFSAMMLAYAIVILCNALGVHPLASALLLAAASLLWLFEFQVLGFMPFATSLAYGVSLVAMYIATTGSRQFWQSVSVYETQVVLITWLAHAIHALVVVYVILKLLREHSIKLNSRAGWLALSASILLALSSIAASGLALCGLLIILGFAGGNRVLLALSLLALVAYLSFYYYSLETTLFNKSLLLMGIGLLLLLGRWGLKRWYWQQRYE